MKKLIKDKLQGRTQRWLCVQVGMTDVEMSNAINEYRAFRKSEFDRIKATLNISKKEVEDYGLGDYVFMKEVQTN